ncbi:hypothetical protein SAMN04487965_2598 [Microbulbifer donghaiensis]|uniref:Uncharacterized protein n=1 Tax=Microbulbifer donghaiensis TaxID=494016 RepID=A0A1M5E699_9GAMM|nr:hypothetical protein [Microbulbifer donghaiensis]SHF74571.1 hypothetical protein SAMN04487965_2598 [Microbulbifer donghaiensis]
MWKRMFILLLLTLLTVSCARGVSVCTDNNKSRPLPFPHAMA